MADVLEDLLQRDMTFLYELRFWALTALRIFLGVTFAYHGFLRLFVPGNLSGSAVYFAQAGIPLPIVSSFVFGVIEFVGGALLLIGLITKWSSIVMFLAMSGIFFLVHFKNGLLAANNGYEFVLLLIGALLFVIVNGSGHLAFGKLFKNKNLH